MSTPLAPRTVLRRKQHDPTPTAAELAALTPADRDRVVDLVRVAAIVVVVLGHWLMAVVTWDGRALHGSNLLESVPTLRWATWLLQVMPLFFLAGGVANAASWTSARRRGDDYARWLQGRMARLVPPVAALAGAWIVGAAVAAQAGVDSGLLRTGMRLVAMPLWFMAVYLSAVALAPPMLAAHRRWGHRVPIVLGLAAIAVDLAAHTSLLASLAWANFAFVWLFAHQLGFFWWEGRMRRRADGVLLAAGGIAGLVLLTRGLGYAVSMVGLPGQASNNTPPTVALVALACGQAGLLSLARPGLARWLERPRVWSAVVRGNLMAMTVYLWHLTALCVGTLLLVRSGWFPQASVASLSWWLLRPVWLLALLALLVPLVRLWGRVERAAIRLPAPGAALASPLRRAAPVCAGALLLVGFLTWVAIHGFPLVRL